MRKKRKLKKTDKLILNSFEKAGAMSKIEIRDIISNVEITLQKCEQIEVPVVHHFSKDVYAREMRMKAGELIVGKIHKFENLNILSKGEASVLSIDGVIKLKAPATFVGSPGAKRLIFAHTDVIWTTIHGTSETDVDKIEETFIATTYEFENESTDILIEVKKENVWLG